jgi:hypothetical protein
MSEQRLPNTWVEALFARFRAVWGAQKVTATYRPSDGDDLQDWAEDLHNLWATQLARFNGPTLKAALQAAIDSGREWPPTLPEFKALCQQFNRPEHVVSAPALPAPRTEMAADTVALLKVAMRGNASLDPMFWAKRPASRVAVELLVRGAQHDPRLRDILRAHLAAPRPREHHPRAAEALQALRELAKNPPAFLGEKAAA